MARTNIKVKEHENLSDETVKRVIDLLEAEKPITKKEAYEILNIKANPTRLAKIIESYKERQAESSRRRAANRGKPASQFEIQTIIENFLDGEAIAEIAKRIYRSTTFVKEVIEVVGVPQKPTGADYTNFGLIPEKCSKDSFEIGQIVWSAKRHCMAIVLGEAENRTDKTNKYYQIFVIEPIEEPSPYFPQYQDYGGFHDGSYAYDLGSLDHLKEYGVDVYRPYRAHFRKWLEGK